MDRLVPMKKNGNGVTDEQLRRAGAELFHILNRDGSFSPAYLESEIDQAKRITVRDHAPATKLPTVGERKQGTIILADAANRKGCAVPEILAGELPADLITVPKMAEVLKVPVWAIRQRIKLAEGRITVWGRDEKGTMLYRYKDLLPPRKKRK